jgi:mono/diheme cytochrome c family protein
MTLRIPGLEMGKVDKKKLSKGERSQGKILFERNFGCISCHRALNLVGKTRGGVSGASLVNSDLRLNPDWVFNWLKNPKKFFSKSGMPLYDLKEETAVLVTKYILSIRTSP